MKLVRYGAKGKELPGIIDSDGHYQKHTKQYEVTFKSKVLMEDTVFLARSLGFGASFKEIQKTCCNTGAVGTYYRTQIYGNELCEVPVLLQRKVAEQRL